MEPVLVESLVAQSEAVCPGSAGVVLAVVAQMDALADRVEALEAVNADLNARLAWCETEMATAEALVTSAIVDVRLLVADLGA